MESKSLYAKVFMWMFIGLLVTFLTGYIVSINENMLINIFGKNIWIFLTIAELILVMVLSARIRKMKAIMAKIKGENDNQTKDILLITISRKKKATCA